jgi:hypothetical protein
MKPIKLRLTLDVEFDPQGMTVDRLKDHLYRVVRDATNNGTLTGDTPATVEHYTASVKQLRS